MKGRKDMASGRTNSCRKAATRLPVLRRTGQHDEHERAWHLGSNLYGPVLVRRRDGLLQARMPRWYDPLQARMLDVLQHGARLELVAAQEYLGRVRVRQHGRQHLHGLLHLHPDLVLVLLHARTCQPATERAASSISSSSSVSSSTVIEYRSIVFDRRSDADVRERQRRRVHGRRGRIDLDRSRVSTARSLGPESELCTPRAGQQSSSTSKLKRVIVVVVVVPSSGAARLPLPLSGAYHASSRPELEFESELIGSPRTWRPRDLSGSVRKLSSERMASCTLRTSDDETSAAARCDAALCGSDVAPHVPAQVVDARLQHAEEAHGLDSRAGSCALIYARERDRERERDTRCCDSEAATNERLTECLVDWLVNLDAEQRQQQGRERERERERLCERL